MDGDSYITRAYVMDLYNNPHNYGKLDNYDFSFKGNNPLCGDKITLYIKLNKDIIEDISFESEGCIISSVSSSILTDEVKGKSLSYIKNNLKFSDIEDKLLIKLSSSREKCARLSFESIISLIEENNLK